MVAILAIFFSAPTEAPTNMLTVDSLTERPATRPKVLATLGEGGRGVSFEVRFQQPPRGSSSFGLDSERFFGARERPSCTSLA